jgi:hypothetical protein
MTCEEKETQRSKPSKGDDALLLEVVASFK